MERVGKGLLEFGEAEGVRIGAKLEHAQGLAYANGVLYVADTYNHKLRTVAPQTLEVVTVAGGEGAGFRDGALGTALPSEPLGMSVAGDLVYVSDARRWLGGLRSAHAVVGEISEAPGAAAIDLGPDTFTSVVAPSRTERPIVVARLY